jgi:hypothetical protein
MISYKVKLNSSVSLILEIYGPEYVIGANFTTFFQIKNKKFFNCILFLKNKHAIILKGWNQAMKRVFLIKINSR